jgi:hypothetical protein
MRFSFGSFTNSSVTNHSSKGLEHTSPENPLAEMVLNSTPLAPVIGPAPPGDRRRARAAGGLPRRPSLAAGDTSETSSHPPFDASRSSSNGVARSVPIRPGSMRHCPRLTLSQLDRRYLDRRHQWVRSGNFVYFDTATRTIGPEHIMRGLATRIPRRRGDRGRALLGRRSSLKHATAMAGRQPSSPFQAVRRMLAWRR